ncbi:hypothetical protein, partial [Mesobacillus foraminis]|uniref:hypothetical protein n=1 Tax=Mesobacillus foraminis TaxID=279826 RepID=UPI001A7EFA94
SVSNGPARHFYFPISLVYFPNSIRAVSYGLEDSHFKVAISSFVPAPYAKLAYVLCKQDF